MTQEATVQIMSDITLEPENRIKWKTWKKRAEEEEAKKKRDVDLSIPWKLTRITMPEDTFKRKEEYVRRLKRILQTPQALRRAATIAINAPRVTLPPFVPIPTPEYITNFDVTDPLGLKKL